MSKMFFFEKDPAWMQYINELGIQAVIDYLKGGGHPCGWPLYVADPSEKHVTFLPHGRGFSAYKSKCPNYEGYYLGGSRAAVKCTACPDLLPGIVVDTMCTKDFTACPYCRQKENTKNEQYDIMPLQGG